MYVICLLLYSSCSRRYLHVLTHASPTRLSSDLLGKYQTAQPCETCHGARLRPEPLAVKIAGEDISQSARRSVADALHWFGTLEEKLNDQQKQIADRKSTRLNSSH